jgi:hypothetical protein
MTKRYDLGCLTLAEYFLSDLPGLSAEKLAAHIQRAVDDWIDNEQTARQPLPQPRTQGGGLFTEEEWRHLPIATRQRWWEETDYGRRPPTPELKAEIDRAIAAFREQPR